MATPTEHHEPQPPKQQQKSAEQTAQAAAELLGGGLKQIQRIIVEPRARELEASIEALEERRMRDLAELRHELDRSLSRSDDFIKKESSILNDRLQTERRERSRALDDRVKELQARTRELEERLEKLRQSVTDDARELRQLILEQHRSFGEELRSSREEIARAIARELSGLRSEKADRSVLAELLSEVGSRLSGEEEQEHVTH